MDMTGDLLTLSIEVLIVRAARRYVQRQGELRSVPEHARARHIQLIAEHRRNIERLVTLRASLLRDQDTTQRRSGALDDPLSASTGRSDTFELVGHPVAHAMCSHFGNA
jgi:hypothetical protein